MIYCNNIKYSFFCKRDSSYHSVLKKNYLYLKDEFFYTNLNCKYVAKKFSTSSALHLPVLKEQSEKTLIFFHDDLWEEEEKFRSRYCLRIIFALKKYQENNPRPTVSNASLELNILSKNVKLALSYLKNSLVTDLDRVNSKFLLFLYFLTKTNYFSTKNNKKKFILRNLFFSFIFFASRREYFLNLSSSNSLISKNYILYKPRIRYVTSVFPQGLFLILYSPYKSSFQFSSTNLFLSRQFLFSKRLNYIKNLISSSLSFSKSIRNYNSSYSFFFSVNDNSKLKISNLALFLNTLDLKKKTGISMKNKILSFKSDKKSNSVFYQKMKFSRYYNKIDFSSKQNLKKKIFTISRHFNFSNNFYFIKFLRKFFWRQLNKFKLRIYRLGFYFYRRFPKKVVSSVLKLVSKFRFLFSEFIRWLNFSSQNFFCFNIGFFFKRIFSNFMKIEKFLFFFDSFNNAFSKKFTEKKKAFHLQFDVSNRNTGFVLFDVLKIKILQNSLSSLDVPKITKIKAREDFDLLLRLNLTLEIDILKRKFLFKTLPYEIFQTNVSLLIESFKFLDKFKFTLKFLFFSKFFFVKKFISIFSSFFSLFYLLFNCSQPYSILQNFHFFPIYYYYNFSKLNFYNFKISNNSMIIEVYDFLLNKYKSFFNIFMLNRAQLMDYEAIRNKFLGKRFINFKFLRKNVVQKFIIDRENLRNLEFLSDHMKRFVKNLKDSPRAIRSSFSVKYFTKKKNRKKSYINGNPSYSNDLILNSRQKHTRYLAYKTRQKKYIHRIKNYRERIAFLKSHIISSEYFFDSYFYRFNFKKYITPLEYKRQRKRFYINVLFFNKFIKEKRISVIYHKLLKGSHKISVFHKFSNPFFLRLKLKRYFVFRGKSRRTLSRFSFLTSSVNLKLFMSKMMYLVFLNTRNFNKILYSHSSNLLSLTYFSSFNLKFDRVQISEKFVIFNWLSHFKVKYFNFLSTSSSYVFNFLRVSNQKLFHYFLILQFFFYQGVLIFVKNLYDLINEIFSFLSFFESLKRVFRIFSFFNLNSLLHNRIKSGALFSHQYLPFFQNSRNYSTYLIKISNEKTILSCANLNLHNKKVVKFKYFFFNNLNKRFFMISKYSFILSNFVTNLNSKFFTFRNFFYLSFLKIFFFHKNIVYDFLKFFKQISQLMLFFSNYSFPYINKSYQFSDFNYISDNKNIFSLNQTFFGIGFFTFFYSSFRNFSSVFSRSIYSFISSRRLKLKKNRLKKNRFEKKNLRKQVYYNKFNSPNSVYYLSNKKRIYKGFRFFRPNYPYHRMFPYYINYKTITKKARKDMFKNVSFFKIPHKKKQFKLRKNSLFFFKRKKKEMSKNFRTTATLRTFNIRLHLSKKKFVFGFSNHKFLKRKKIYDRFLYLSLKRGSKKFPCISSSTIPLTEALFKPNIFRGTLLKSRLNSIFTKFSVHPFKKLFQVNQNLSYSSSLLDKSNLFLEAFNISKDLFLKFYGRNLTNFNLTLLNIKIQRFFRLLIFIFNQCSLYLKTSVTFDNALTFNKKNLFYFYDYLFTLNYFELFYFSDCILFDSEVENSCSCIIKFITNIEFNNLNIFFSDLINFFYFENVFSYSDLFFSVFSYYSTNTIVDSFFRNFFIHQEEEFNNSNLLLTENNINNDIDFFLDNNFFFQFIKFYVYILNYHHGKEKLFFKKIILLESLLTNFQFSFLQFLKLLNCIQFIKKEGLTFVILNNNFFYFLSNFFLIFFSKFFHSTNLLNSQLFSFVLNIFSYLFDYDSIFRKFTNILSKKLNFFKSNNLKVDFKLLFLKMLRLSKNFKTSSSLGISFLKKNLYVNFKYHNNYKKHVSKRLNRQSSLISIPAPVSSHNSGRVLFSQSNNNTDVVPNWLLNSKSNRVFNFLRIQKLTKFSLSSKLFRKIRLSQMRKQRSSFDIKPLHYRSIRKVRRHSRKLSFQRFYNYSFDSKIQSNEFFFTFFLVKKVRNIKIFSMLKNNYVRKFSSFDNSFLKNKGHFYREKNRLEPFFKKLLKRLRLNRVKLNKRHLLMKSKFHPIVRQKIFLSFLLSPKFFNFKNISNSNLFFQKYSSDKLKEKLFLFLRMNRFLEFVTKLILKVKLFIRKNIFSISLDKFHVLNKVFSLNSFLNILKIYRKIKLLLRYFFNKLIFQTRKKRGLDDKHIINLNINSNLSTLKFMFFYNFLSLKFFKSFILRYFFFGEYLKLRFQFINRYLWFRTVPLNIFLLTPKVYIIITKARNNFFVTAIDLYGRILYKSSPGMVKFTGSDRMSKYAWFETSVDFFDGFIEFFRYFLKSKKKKKTSYSAIRIDREYSMRFNRIKKKFTVFMHPAVFYLAERRKLKKKAKKRRGKLKTRLRRFFIISKGISDFNLRIFLKGMVSDRFYVSHYFAGAVNYPMRSFSLCRIKKVRRV